MCNDTTVAGRYFLGARSRHHGVLMIWWAIIGIVLILFLALATDAAHVYLAAHELQNAADAAALAGAARVKFSTTDAVNAAINAAAANKAGRAPASVQVTNGDVTIGHYDRGTRVFAAGATPFNAVQVNARRTDGSPGGALPLFFGPALGTVFGRDLSNAQVNRKATAASGGQYGAGIIALDPTRKSAFDANGNITVTVTNGGIQVNSNSAGSVGVNGSAATINAISMRTAGTVSIAGAPTIPAIETNATPVADPLAWLPAPPIGAPLAKLTVNTNGTQTINPGNYANGIDVKKGTLILNPGVYIIGGTGLNLGPPQGTVIANGVMFYFTGGATWSFGQQSNLTLTPPTNGTYKDISVFVDRTTPYKTFGFTGHKGISVTGTFYMPSVAIDLQGTPDVFVNQVIAATFHFGGNSTMTVNYDGRNPVEINTVFLVF